MAARRDILFCFTDLARDFDGRRHALSRHHWHTDPRRWNEIMGPPVQYSSVAELPLGIDDFGVYIGNIYRGEMHTNYLSTICLMHYGVGHLFYRELLEHAIPSTGAHPLAHSRIAYQHENVRIRPLTERPQFKVTGCVQRFLLTRCFMHRDTAGATLFLQTFSMPARCSCGAARFL
jgi:hypothetical protein